MSTDVTDATFATDVVDRSREVAVVVDLWAPWCGPCKTLGPILEKVVDETDGKVELVKINVDDNPQAAQAFRVQGIPAVYALQDGQVVDGFVGAQGEPAVREFVSKLLPTEEESQVDALVAEGNEPALRRALELDPDHEGAILALAELLITQGDVDEALQLLERIPESNETRRLAALARTGSEVDDVETKLDSLLPNVKADEAARQEYLDLLELMGADDPRTTEYRRKLTAVLF